MEANRKKSWGVFFKRQLGPDFIRHVLQIGSFVSGRHKLPFALQNLGLEG